MIIVDYSQTIISNLMAELGGRKDVDLEINLLRHMVLNTLRSYHTKFKREYGEMVIACDNKKYWRKEIFPHYKANRKKAREDSGYDWNLIFDAINTIKKELKEIFPYKVIEVESSEADDIIATLCKTQRNEPILIISGDHDFIQLQKYDNVKQYSPIQKKFVVSPMSSDKVVLEHIIKGDKGDGIPNVLTSDEAIINGERQKPISSKKLTEWMNDPTTMPHDDTFIKNYKRNQLLVDLSKIPQRIEESILNTFTNYPQKDKSMILDYFIEHKMKHMLEHIEEF
jgi:5'-3' exonuclease